MLHQIKKNNKNFYPSFDNYNPVLKKSNNNSIPPTKIDDSQPAPKVFHNNPNERILASIGESQKIMVMNFNFKDY